MELDVLVSVLGGVGACVFLIATGKGLQADLALMMLAVLVPLTIVFDLLPWHRRFSMEYHQGRLMKIILEVWEEKSESNEDDDVSSS